MKNNVAKKYSNDFKGFVEFCDDNEKPDYKTTFYVSLGTIAFFVLVVLLSIYK